MSIDFYLFLYIAFCALCFHWGYLAGVKKYKSDFYTCMEAKKKVIKANELP